MKLRPIILMLCLLPACADFSERRKISHALRDYRDSQAEFNQRYAPEIEDFNRYSKP